MIGVILELSIKEGRRENFIEMMKSILPETRAFDGCQKFDVWTDNSDAAHVVLNEIWDSVEQHQAYLGWRVENGTLNQLVAFLNEPPAPKYFEILDA
ncbi:MAG: antibiotic biosynthesis monooxygenase [Pseudomonadota bacterium]